MAKAVEAGQSAQSVGLVGKNEKLTSRFKIATNTTINSIINAMPKYNHRQHVLSDWLAKLDQRFQLGEVGGRPTQNNLVSASHWHQRLQHPLQFW